MVSRISRAKLAKIHMQIYHGRGISQFNKKEENEPKEKLSTFENGYSIQKTGLFVQISMHSPVTMMTRTEKKLLFVKSNDGY